MRIKPSVASVVGPTTTTHWGQVLMLPNAYGVIEVEDSDGIARQVGVRALSLLNSALTKGITSLAQLQEAAEHTVNEGALTILLFVPVGSVAYIVLRGKGIVYIKRGNTLSKLINHNTAISGEVQTGDTFLFASCGFEKALGHEEISTLFDHLTPSEVAEKLTLMLHKKTAGVGSAALIYQVSGFIEHEPFVPQESSHELGVKRPHEMVLHRVIARARRAARTVTFRPKNRIAAISVALGTLFVISVGLGIMKQTKKAKNQQIVRTLAEAQHAFDEGVALLDLNPVKGRERLTTAKASIEPLVSRMPPRSSEGRQLALLYTKIQEHLTQSLHSKTVTLQLFYDVSLLKKGSSIGDMALYQTALALLDTTTGTVYQLDIASKKGQIIAGGASFEGATLVGIHGDRHFVLGSSGIHQVDVDDKKTSSAVISKDDAWGDIRDLVSFAGNIYLLDAQKGRIWKYVVTEKGFSTIREYLNPDTLVDLSQATTLSIDGAVWVGTRIGKLFKFTQGKEDTFISIGIDPPLGTNLVAYTNDELKHLYVLDAENKRVVVLDKDGMYVAQYAWEDALPVSDLVVSEASGKILLLGEGKLYVIELI